MKAHSNHHHTKLKPPPRHLFSCGFFRYCTQTLLSPTTPSSPILPPPHPQTTLPHLQPPPPLPQPQQPPPSPPHAPPSKPPAPPPPPPQHDSSSSSTTTSSSSTSQSFTQWRFPTPMSTQYSLHSAPPPRHPQPPRPPPLQLSALNLEELFHLSMLQLASGSDEECISALHALERSLVPNPPPDPVCPPELMRGVVKTLNQPTAAKSATKVLLALCLAEPNRRVAVEVGAVGEVMEAVAEMECATAERALAALELMCTVAEGAAELRSHALAVPLMVEMIGRLEGHRGKEYAMSVLAVIYGGGMGVAGAAPPDEVARAVGLALQGECSARGRRKGALLLKVLKEISDQRLDDDDDANQDQIDN